MSRFIPSFQTVLILAGGGVALLFMYFQFQFISEKVNPESIAAYRVAEAKRECALERHRYMDELRWCVMIAPTRHEEMKCIK